MKLIDTSNFSIKQQYKQSEVLSQRADGWSGEISGSFAEVSALDISWEAAFMIDAADEVPRVISAFLNIDLSFASEDKIASSAGVSFSFSFFKATRISAALSSKNALSIFFNA